MLEKLPGFIIMYPALILAITAHEFAHAWAASKLGDNTARNEGRVSFNPLHHIDLIGTVILPLMMIFTATPFLIGWAKPVPVNPCFLKNPKKDTLWISLAGPIANLILMFILSIIFYFIRFLPLNSNFIFVFEPLMGFISICAYLNLILAFFNLVPIPPLDGSGVLKGLLPYRYLIKYEEIFNRYGFIILLILLFSGALQLYLKFVIGILKYIPFIRVIL
ncbi:MAG: site-2 protease family protein [bacterium]